MLGSNLIYLEFISRDFLDKIYDVYHIFLDDREHKIILLIVAHIFLQNVVKCHKFLALSRFMVVCRDLLRFNLDLGEVPLLTRSVRFHIERGQSLHSGIDWDVYFLRFVLFYDRVVFIRAFVMIPSAPHNNFRVTGIHLCLGDRNNWLCNLVLRFVTLILTQVVLAAVKLIVREGLTTEDLFLLLLLMIVVRI